MTKLTLTNVIRQYADRGVKLGGIGSSVADALTIVRGLAIGHSAGGTAAQLARQAAQQRMLPETARSNRLYAMRDAQGWIRTGPPDFKVIREDEQPTYIPRHTRLRVIDVAGNYSKVEDEDHQQTAWTLSTNLTYYFRENEPMLSATMVPVEALDPEQGSDNARAAVQLFNRVGGLLQVCAEEICRKDFSHDGTELRSRVVAWTLATFIKEFSGAAHTPGRAGIRFEPRLFRDQVLQNEDERSSFSGYFFQNASGSWRFSVTGNGEAGDHVPLYPNSQGGVTGEFFQNRQYLAKEAAERILSDHDLDVNLALKAISVGGPQILMSDLHYDLYCGYDSPRAMWDAFQGNDERFHVLGFFDFIRNKRRSGHSVSQYIQKNDFSEFGLGYNGGGRYGSELEAVFEDVKPLF